MCGNLYICVVSTVAEKWKLPTLADFSAIRWSRPIGVASTLALTNILLLREPISLLR